MWCCLSLCESSGTLVYFKWKTLPYFIKFLFSDVCSFFSVFVKSHISFLSKAVRFQKVEFWVSLVLNITCKHDYKAAFSPIPTHEMWQFSSIWWWWGALIKSTWATSICSDSPLLTVCVCQCMWMRRRLCKDVWCNSSWLADSCGVCPWLGWCERVGEKISLQMTQFVKMWELLEAEPSDVSLSTEKLWMYKNCV